MAASFHDQANLSFGAPVVTPRLIIYPWQDGDETTIANFLNADAGIFPHRTHYFAYNTTGPFNQDRVRNEVFPALRKLYKENCILELYIRDQADNRIIGMIDFSRDHFGRDRVGYFILPSERRHGFAFEAYTACLHRAVETGFLSGNLYAHTELDNTTSQNFLRKAGFHDIGKIKTHNKCGEDQFVMAFSRPLSKLQWP